MGHVSGGVVMFIHKRLSRYVEKVDTGIENIVCAKLSRELFGCERDILLFGLYNHPINSVYYEGKEYDCTLDCVEEFILSRMANGEDVFYMFTGDVNARISNWCLPAEVLGDDDDENESYDGLSMWHRDSSDKVTNGFGKKLIQLCTMFQFTPLNGLSCNGFDSNFTFFSDRGNSVIDFFICSVDLISYVSSLQIVSRVESQHMPVEIVVSDALNLTNEKVKSSKAEKLLWDKDKAHLFLANLGTDEAKRGLTDALNSIDTDVDLALDKFVGTLLTAGQCMRRNVSSGSRVNQNKWFDTECREVKRQVTRALRRYMCTLSEEDKNVYKEKRSQYQQLIKEKKKSYRQAMQDMLTEKRKNGSEFWKTIRNARKRNRNQANINIGAWKDHFANILGHREPLITSDRIEEDRVNVDYFDQSNNDVDDQRDTYVYISDLDDQITTNEVRQAIRRLKAGKACGLDDILAEFIKSAEHVVIPFLTKLFNHIFNTGNFPESWSKAVIIPLFKKGDKNNPENYRGISLLSIVSKVFTSILNNRLTKWAEQEHKICEEQAGFRKNYGTSDHIFTLVSMIKQCLFGSKKSKFYVAFIDYAKAFDSVDRESLWMILRKIETSTKMLQMLQGMYRSVKSCVKWANETSDFFECPYGVRQGCLLSPLIFSLLITEVAENVNRKGKHGFQFLPGMQEIFMLLFADDICLMSTSPTGLQNQINNLEEASTRLGLKVNLSKTKIIVFRKGGHLSKFEKWYYQGQEIETLNSYKYLGFTLTTRMSVNNALEELAGRAKCKVVEILKTMWSLGNMDPSLFFKLFDAQVKPMLLYSAEIWGLTKYKTIESAHLFACKSFLQVPLKTPNAMVYGELGRYPLYVDSTIRAMKYWFKLRNLPQTRLPKQAYCMDYNRFSRKENQADNHNWAYCIKSTLDSFGFSDVWLNGGVGNEYVFLKILKQRMVDCYKQNWFSKLSNSDRFATYRSFKSLLQSEQYLYDITLMKFRKVFVYFRIGINDLYVNKNRYTAQDNVCPFCNALEDELHFLLHCKFYEAIRKKYLSKYYSNLDLNRLCSWIDSDDAFKTRSVAMYIYYAMKLREDTLALRN